MIDCCNDEPIDGFGQCQGEYGANAFYAAGCVRATFEDRCDASAEAAFPGVGLLGSDSYVDCVGGLVKGTTTSQTCADACGGKCCIGSSACGFIFSGTVLDGFTGKGKQRVV